MMDALHERLETAWRNRGFQSASDAARAYGWPVSTFRSHSNGNREFDVETAIKYARGLKVSPLWLLGLERYAGEGEAGAAPEADLNLEAVASIIGVFAKLEREAPLPPAVLQSLHEIVRQVLQAMSQNEATQNNEDHLATAVKAIIAPYRAPKQTP